MNCYDLLHVDRWENMKRAAIPFRKVASGTPWHAYVCFKFSEWSLWEFCDVVNTLEGKNKTLQA